MAALKESIEVSSNREYQKLLMSSLQRTKLRIQASIKRLHRYYLETGEWSNLPAQKPSLNYTRCMRTVRTFLIRYATSPRRR